jgi:hypothetical protein
MSSSSVACDLRLCGDMWVISGDPYILYRAEQAIPFSEKLEGGSIGYPATDEIAVELMWFLQRFKVNNHHECDLRRAAARHNLRRVETGRILAGDFRTDAINFRDGLRPREYQSQAAMLWRANTGLLCADELGTGKTLVGIAGIADRAMLPAVVVAPANLTLQWMNQLDRFLSGFQSHVIYQQRNYDLRVVSTCKECGEAATAKAVAIRKCSYCGAKNFARTLADVYLISYNKVHFWHKELERITKSIVFDEAQDLRRCESKRYEACRALARKVSFRLGLSSTPVHNYGGEMFNVMDVLCPKKLGSKKHFREQWCKASIEAGKEPMLKEPEALSRYLMQQGLMIRRTREDVGREIPKSQMIFHHIKPDEKVYAKMTSGAKELARVLLQLNSKNLAKGAQMKAAGELEAMVYRATGVSKAPYVAQFVRLLLESGEPVMLFGYHRDVYEIWCRELRDFNPVLYTGSEGPAQKEAAKNRFVNGESNLLICSLKSGRGLDGIQHRCHIGVFGELDHSPAVISQSQGRYHRDGQKDESLTYMVVSDFGSDPYMLQSLGIKKVQVDGVVQNKEKTAVLSERDSINHLKQLAEQFLQSA